MQKHSPKFVVCTLISAVCIFAFSGSRLSAQSLPVLPADPSVSSGTLPNGISWAIAAAQPVKGVADFVLIKSAGGVLSASEYTDVPVYKGKAVCDSLVRCLIDEVYSSIAADSLKYGTDNQYIIVAGDVKAAEIEEMLKTHSAGRPSSKSAVSASEYVWEGPCIPRWETDSCGPGRIKVSAEFRHPRIADSLMPTVVPLVSLRMDGILDIIVEKSIAASLERNRVPYSGIVFNQIRSWDGFGDEIYRISFTVAENDAASATAIAQGVVAQLLDKGVPHSGYAGARSQVMSGFHAAVGRTLPNNQNTRRLASHLLFGTTPATAESIYNFFVAKDVPDSVQLRSINRFSKEIFGGSPVPDSISWRTRLLSVNKGDTLAFPQPSKKKAKVDKSTTDFVTGGTSWTFGNGLTVIYKQMSTGGSLYYSMIFNCGASDNPSAAPGESAFYSELFHSASVGSLSGSDFRNLHSSCGISLDCNVGLYDMALYGKCPSSKLQLMLGTLLQAMNSRRFSLSAAKYTIACEALSVSEAEDNYAHLYTALHPGYRYVSERMSEGLVPGMEQNAERLFEKAFARCDDGVLVLVGDRSADAVLKVLRQYASYFRTAGKLKKTRSVAFTTIAGEREFHALGGNATYVEASCAADYTADNYFASRVLEEAVGRMLSECGARVEVALNPRPSEHLDIRISASGNVPVEDLLSPLRALSSGDNAVYDDLKGWCTMAANRNTAMQSDPEYWIRAARIRFTDSKDIVSKSGDKISAVSAERIAGLSRALLSGGRVCLVSED